MRRRIKEKKDTNRCEGKKPIIGYSSLKGTIKMVIGAILQLRLGGKENNG